MEDQGEEGVCLFSLDGRGTGSFDESENASVTIRENLPHTSKSRPLEMASFVCDARFMKFFLYF